MWAHVLTTGLGIWLMAAPEVLRYHGPARTIDYIIGPLVATFACVAIWQVTRSLRGMNVLLGVGLVVVPWIAGYDWQILVHSTVVGLLIAGLSCVPGRLRQSMGGGWSALWSTAN